MLKETLRKLMNLSLEEKPEGKITEVKIGNTSRGYPGDGGGKQCVIH